MTQLERNLKFWKQWYKFKRRANEETQREIDSAIMEWHELNHAGKAIQPNFRVFMSQRFNMAGV